MLRWCVAGLFEHDRGGALTYLIGGDVQRRDAGAAMGRHVDIVEAGYRCPRRCARFATGIPAGRRKRGYRCRTSLPWGARADAAVQQSAACVWNRVVPFDDVAGGQPDISAREGPKEALYAVGCAVIVARDSRDDAEAAVADVDEIASDALGLGNVVPAHAWPWRVRVVMAGRHEGNGLGAQQFIDVRTATASDEQHSIDATFEQRAYFTCLAFGLVVGARKRSWKPCCWIVCWKPSTRRAKSALSTVGMAAPIVLVWRDASERAAPWGM